MCTLSSWLFRIDDDGDEKTFGSQKHGKATSPSNYEEKDEEFAFARTVSRLNHTQSAEYLSAAWAEPGKAFMIHLESSHLTEGDLRRYGLNDNAMILFTRFSRCYLLIRWDRAGSGIGTMSILIKL